MLDTLETLSQLSHDAQDALEGLPQGDFSGLSRMVNNFFDFEPGDSPGTTTAKALLGFSPFARIKKLDNLQGAKDFKYSTLGKGSTADLAKGTTLPRNLREQLAVDEVLSNPASGTQLPVKLADPRWPASDGWVKMQKVVNPGGPEGLINVHYLRNTITNQVDDFKIVVQGSR